MKFTLLLSVIFVASIGAAVVDLTSENFDSIVDGSKNVFVEFYAPWCGHCKNLAPAYDVVGESFSKISDVVIAKIDADAHKDIGGRFGVSGFPTLKFFPIGKKDSPIPYDGERTAEAIVNFVNQHAGANGKVKKAPTDVVILTDSNFDKIVLDGSKDVLVEFYAPWCGHCKSLAPIWEKLATAYSNEKDVVIANIDADKYRDIGGRYGVSGFPTIKYFPKNNKETPEPYEGARELNEFVTFINNKAGTRRSVDGKLDSHAGKLAEFEHVVSKFLSGDQKVLLAEAEELVKGLTGDAIQYGKIYTKYMSTIIEKGKDWILTEIQRLEKLLSGSLSANKLDEFTKRKNILSHFQ